MLSLHTPKAGVEDAYQAEHPHCYCILHRLGTAEGMEEVEVSINIVTALTTSWEQNTCQTERTPKLSLHTPQTEGKNTYQTEHQHCYCTYHRLSRKGAGHIQKKTTTLLLHISHPGGTTYLSNKTVTLLSDILYITVYGFHCTLILAVETKQ